MLLLRSRLIPQDLFVNLKERVVGVILRSQGFLSLQSGQRSRILLWIGLKVRKYLRLFRLYFLCFIAAFRQPHHCLLRSFQFQVLCPMCLRSHLDLKVLEDLWGSEGNKVAFFIYQIIPRFLWHNKYRKRFPKVLSRCKREKSLQDASIQTYILRQELFQHYPNNER